MSLPEFRRQIALRLLAEELPSLDLLLPLMDAPCPAYEASPLKHHAWLMEAHGHYCFAMADKVLQGYEARRTAWSRD